MKTIITTILKTKITYIVQPDTLRSLVANVHVLRRQNCMTLSTLRRRIIPALGPTPLGAFPVAPLLTGQLKPEKQRSLPTSTA